jgi:hypothetical protein
MGLTADLVREKAAEYERNEPLYVREQEHVETLPDVFPDGDFGWRDTEWVVRWYYRRFLGAYPNADRMAVEDAYDDNDYESVRDAMVAADAADDPADAVAALTDLTGVDVGVASAFLLFIDPERYISVGEREWGVLREYGVLDDPYPAELTSDEYATYLGACRDLCERLGCSLWTLYRALWRLGKDD